MSEKNGHSQIAVARNLPANVPDGAKAFQAAVDGKLTKDIWETILDAQIKKATEGDRGAARFLLEYAGGVASMRGATFVQENHQHDHYHDSVNGVGAGPRLTDANDPADHAVDAIDPSDRIPSRRPADFVRERERIARRAATSAADKGAQNHGVGNRASRTVPA